MLPGTVVAKRYRIQRQIGQGSFGTVYLAEDLQTQEPRAIKILLPWAARNEELRHRLRREARLAGSLTNPHAVKIHDLGETEKGDVFLAMEYLEGEELSTLTQSQQPVDPERVKHIAEQVLDALDEAHRLGIIHRDLKPSNIFLCKSADGLDHVKVFDFGIAKVTGEGGLMATAKLTMSGGVMGTPIYMSPEQCRGVELTPAADFYSLGIILYELLAGSAPFDDLNPVQVLLKHNQEPVPPLPDSIAATPLGKAVMRALEKDPVRRFVTASDFLRAIRGEAVDLPPLTEPPPTSGDDDEPVPNPGPGKRGCLGSVAGLIGVGLALATWLAWLN